jgi:hypothetical protein
MKATAIFLVIVTAALGAIGITTSIMSSGIPAYAVQAGSQQSGHSTSSCSGDTCSFTFSGNLDRNLVGGGRETLTLNFDTGQASCSSVGSPGFTSFFSC